MNKRYSCKKLVESKLLNLQELELEIMDPMDRVQYGIDQGEFDEDIDPTKPIYTGYTHSGLVVWVYTKPDGRIESSVADVYSDDLELKGWDSYEDAIAYFDEEYGD